MEQELRLKVYSADDLPVRKRPLETKIGEAVRTLDPALIDLGEGLKSAQESGAQYAILGIPEDIGPRANCGRPGADEAWDAFLEKFLNMQSNRFFTGENVLVLGHVDLDDIQTESRNLDSAKQDDVRKLRQLCGEVDRRVYPALAEIYRAGLKPIIVGGGHSNALPAIKAASTVLQERGKIRGRGIAAINCEAHLDFRPTEDGRHSGNPFSYAFEEGDLIAYYVVGMHGEYNSETMLARIDQINKGKKRKPIGYNRFDKILEGQYTFAKAVEQGIIFVSDFRKPVGVEIDLDSIAGMPASAATPSGISAEDARLYVRRVARDTTTAYLHLSEGAPRYASDGRSIVGKALAYLARDFMVADGRRKKSL